MTAEHGVRDQVAMLSVDHQGRWLVTTQGSQSIWDLGKMTYSRSPRYDSISGPLERDHQRWKILQVLRWPRVGGYFQVVFEKPDAPQLSTGMIVKLRSSSIIYTIEQLNTSTTADPPQGSDR